MRTCRMRARSRWASMRRPPRELAPVGCVWVCVLACVRVCGVCARACVRDSVCVRDRLRVCPCVSTPRVCPCVLSEEGALLGE